MSLPCVFRFSIIAIHPSLSQESFVQVGRLSLVLFLFFIVPGETIWPVLFFTTVLSTSFRISKHTHSKRDDIEFLTRYYFFPS